MDRTEGLPGEDTETEVRGDTETELREEISVWGGTALGNTGTLWSSLPVRLSDIWGSRGMAQPMKTK